MLEKFRFLFELPETMETCLSLLLSPPAPPGNLLCIELLILPKSSLLE